MRTKFRFLVGGLAVLAFVTFTPIALQSTNQDSTPLMQIGRGHSTADQKHVVTRSLSSMPLAFTENQGQWDNQVLFRANAGGATMWFSREGVHYQFTRRIPKTNDVGALQLAVGMSHVGGRLVCGESSPLLAGSSTSAPRDINHLDSRNARISLKSGTINGGNSEGEIS